MENKTMNYNCLNILKWTEAQLKYTYDVSLKEATPQELHEALGEAVMMAISDNWNHSKHTRMHNRKAYYISAEYLIGRLVYSNMYNLGILDELKHLFGIRGNRHLLAITSHHPFPFIVRSPLRPKFRQAIPMAHPSKILGRIHPQLPRTQSHPATS